MADISGFFMTDFPAAHGCIPTQSSGERFP